MERKNLCKLEGGSDHDTETSQNFEQYIAKSIEEADRKQKKRYYKFRVALAKFENEIALIGMIILAIYTLFTIALWCSQQTANRINQQSLIDSQRADIVPDIKVMQFQKNGMFWVVPTFINAGATQTVGAWATDTLYPVHNNASGGLGVPQKIDPKTAPQNNFWLGPKQSFQIDGLSQPIKPDYQAALQSGNYSLVYEGILEYRDVFKGTQVHVVRFCYSIWQNSAITGPTGYDVSQCGGNTNYAYDEGKN